MRDGIFHHEAEGLAGNGELGGKVTLEEPAHAEVQHIGEVSAIWVEQEVNAANSECLNIGVQFEVHPLRQLLSVRAHGSD
jgi:hypothetical protein